ncbi:uncharacterized protein [Epargyreus clarus]|uniref:uncharacterized protein n=1 Tax=Epargyreus clarus TaxID=520877 RepID=UPI003C2FF8DB
MLPTTFFFLVALACSRAAPADNPVRVDLPVYDQPKAGPDPVLANPLELENHPSLKRVNDNSLGGLFGHWNNKLETSTPKVGSINYGGGAFSAPVTTLEGALLETEGLGSKTLSVKENVQGVVAGLFQPQPIVDTIKEEEKYGNDGDKFYSTGRALIGGATTVSNFVNSILEVPGTIIRKITRAATEKLNNLGGKLIGL